MPEVPADSLKKTPIQDLPAVHQVLFIQPAFIGDVILFTSLLETWHHAWPMAAIDVLVRKGNEKLFDGHPFIREVRIWNKSNRKYARLIQELRSVRRVGYDAVINPHRHGSSGAITAFSKASIRSGFSNNPWSFAFTHRSRHQLEGGRHEVERNHELIAPWCPDHMLPRLYPSSQLAIPHEWKGAVVLAPASQWFTKKWPAEKWVALIHQLAVSIPEVPVVLMGGPDDESLLHSLMQRARRHPQLHRTPPLSSLAFAMGVVAQASTVVSNDSAPLHLASALHCKAVAVFCSTLPEFGFGPLTPGSFSIQMEGELKCRPCGSHGHKKCPEGHFQCAQAIEVNRVTEAILSQVR